MTRRAHHRARYRVQVPLTMEAWPDFRIGPRVRVARTLEAWPGVRVQLNNLVSVAAAAICALLAAADGDPDPWRYLRDVPEVLSRPTAEPAPAPAPVRSRGVRSGGVRGRR